MRTRTLFIAALSSVLLALPALQGGAAFAADLKLAHVDSKLIFDKYHETKKAQKEYDRQVQKWEQDVANKQKELMELKDKLEKQSLMLSDEKKKEMQADMMKRETEYRTFVEKVYGKNGELLNKNEEFSGPIIQKIKKTVQDVANQEGYDMVLDRAAGAVVFWKKDNDLTQKVIDILNKDVKDAGTAAAPAK
jgi:outer membrane protein